ncbi:MAG: FtsW/RodA/SpoVE family cell cycle protein, partial [Planctomycetota bacterium]
MTQITAPIRSRFGRPSASPSGARAVPRPRLVMMRNAGWMCVGTAAVLSLFGAVAIGHLGVALAAAIAVALPHYRVAQRVSYPLLALLIGMLVFVLIPFVPEAIVRPRNGARRWINLVVTDFQPSELAKIAYVLALASYLRYRSNY